MAFPEGGEVAAMDFVDALSAEPGEDVGGGLVMVFHPDQVPGMRLKEVQLLGEWVVVYAGHTGRL